MALLRGKHCSRKLIQCFRKEQVPNSGFPPVVAFVNGKTVSTTTILGSFNQPLSGNDMHRSGGLASAMRLPVQATTEGLNACFVGVPLDSGTSNRSGTRMGPRQIRTESVMIRPYNAATGAAPFESLQVADIGDVPFNAYNLHEAVRQIREAYRGIIKHGCVPLTLGGDHTLSYPILQAIKGVRIVLASECWNKSLEPLMGEVRKVTGHRPVYISFDIDGLDPSIAPGTGTPEIAGLTIVQGLEIIRGCWGMNVVGADLVEVSPPYDPFGTTALVAANLLFEMLCILPNVKYYKQ